MSKPKKRDRHDWFWIFSITVILCMTILMLGIMAYKVHFNELEYDLCLRRMAYDRMFDYMEKVHGGGMNETEQGIQIPEPSF